MFLQLITDAALLYGSYKCVRWLIQSRDQKFVDEIISLSTAGIAETTGIPFSMIQKEIRNFLEEKPSQLADQLDVSIKCDIAQVSASLFHVVLYTDFTYENKRYQKRFEMDFQRDDIPCDVCETFIRTNASVLNFEFCPGKGGA